MSSIYQGSCRRCGYKSVVFSSAYGSVLVDEPTEATRGNITRVGRFFLVALRHPGEHYDLARTGFTWRQLFEQGRFIRTRKVACRHCGMLFSVRNLEAPALGCSVITMIALAVGLISGLVSGVLARKVAGGVVVALAVSYVTGVVLSIVVQLYAWAYTRMHFGERGREIHGHNACPTCRSRAWRSAESLFLRYLCPSCARRSVRVRMVGIS